jgi:hypothetical protein
MFTTPLLPFLLTVKGQERGGDKASIPRLLLDAREFWNTMPGIELAGMNVGAQQLHHIPMPRRIP